MSVVQVEASRASILEIRPCQEELERAAATPLDPVVASLSEFKGTKERNMNVLWTLYSIHLCTTSRWQPAKRFDK